MNPDFPPLRFQDPVIKPRRMQPPQDRRLPIIPQEVRAEKARGVIAEINQVRRTMMSFTDEQRRAVILKLKHDRYISSKDLRGTGLKLLGQSGEDESLVVPKDPDLVEFANRAERLASGSDKDTVVKSPGLLASMKSIEIAKGEDRLSEAFQAVYAQKVTEIHFVYEIELTSLAQNSSSRRKETERFVRLVAESLGNGVHGHVYDQDFQDDGVLLMVGTSGSKLREFVEDPKWWRIITHLDLRPRFRTFKEVMDGFSVADVTFRPPPIDAPTICVIDSGVAVGNPFLKEVLKQDSGRSWVYGASPHVDEHSHGSGVASLAAYYDLRIDEGDVNEANAWIVSARILTADGELDIPRVDDRWDDRQQQAWLLSRILKEIVEHFTPLGVKIFVLSFEMMGHIWSKATRRFIARNAWIARTIDQLSREHDVVFCTITGNLHPQEAQELHDTSDTGYPGYLLTPLAKLLDPGPAALALTVGSVSGSNALQGARHGLIALFGQPSPFTRSGPGFAESVKPDFVEVGGSLARDTETGVFVTNMKTNVVIASSQLTPALRHTHGTSFAAPRVASHLAVLLSEARLLGIEPGNPLLRAFLAVSATPAEIPDGVDQDNALALAGYGKPDGWRALLCQGHSALLYWQGEAPSDSTVIFQLHVPPEIGNFRNSRKRIVVAVASSPPVQKWGVSEYLGTEMKFWLYKGSVSPDQVITQHQREEGEENQAVRGSLDHFPGKLGITRRSVGTLQRDEFTWSRDDDAITTNDFTLAVALPQRARWMKTCGIPLAIVVRVEETTGQFTELYARIKTRVMARVSS